MSRDDVERVAAAERLGSRLVARVDRDPAPDPRALRGAAREGLADPSRPVAVAGGPALDRLGARARALGAGRQALVAARPDVLGGPDAAGPRGGVAVAAALRRGARHDLALRLESIPRTLDQARAASTGRGAVHEARDRGPQGDRPEAQGVHGGALPASRPRGARPRRRRRDGDCGAGVLQGLARDLLPRCRTGSRSAATAISSSSERRSRAVHAGGAAPHGQAGVRPLRRARGRTNASETRAFRSSPWSRTRPHSRR